jgi:23S rRNA (guanosine2251-2'-O)-methyltransferase
MLSIKHNRYHHYAVIRYSFSQMNRSIYLVMHNLRSCYNVGSLLRTADAFAVDKVFMTGYTPYPEAKTDNRLPHIAQKMSRQIHKSALGAEDSVAWSHQENVLTLIEELHEQGFVIAALEQTKSAKDLPGLALDQDIALIVGREVEGLENNVLKASDIHLQIPMLGQKESLNVASAAAVALYQLRFNLRGMDTPD